MKDIEILDNGESEVQITTIGTVIGSDSEGNPIEQNFSEESLKDIANKQTEDILVDVDHESELEGKTEAKGWLSNLKFIEGKGLFGKIKWTDIGRKLIENRVFRWLSPSWLLNEDKTPNYMTSCALTNKPSQIGRIKPIINQMSTNDNKDFENKISDNLKDITKNLKDILNMNTEDLKKLIKEMIEECNKDSNKLSSDITSDVKDDVKETELVPDSKEETEVVPTSEKPESVPDSENNDITEDVKEENIKDEIITQDVKNDEVKEDVTQDVITEDVKEEEDKEDKPVEIIKIESLNSQPSPIINEPEWKHLKGEAFRNWVKKHPMGI